MDYSDFNARKNGKYPDIWPNTGKCVFCDLREKYIIAKNEDAALTVNLFPYIDGHLLVIPIKHIEGFLDISEKVWTSMQEMAALGMKLLKSELDIDDVWLLQRASGGNKAQKSVAHAHMLVLPYKPGLVKWNFQDITLPPIELAERLRSANKK